MLHRVANSLPGLRRCGREESSITDGLLCVGDTAPDIDTAFGGTSHAPIRGVRNGREFGCFTLAGHDPNRSVGS
ncbi:MAG: hypothetical protein QOK02_5009 [Mycobacterium sp.]|nr:hypothetical protein [Mycobacterium sp.]